MCKLLAIAASATLGLLTCGASARAQQAPDMILFNGKIVTVDDKSFTSRIGTIAQAMAVGNGKIVAIGSNSEVRRLAAPSTKLIDLKGRTVLPGLISVHEHPNDWDPVTPAIIKKVLTDDIVIARVIEGSPEEQIKVFPSVLAEAVAKAKPGQWIYIVFTLGRKYEYSTGGNGGFGAPNLDVLDGKLIPKTLLDRLAPNNPVVLRNTFTGMLLNQKAIDESRKVFPEKDVNRANDNTGLGASFRWMFHNVVMRDYYPQLLEIHRLGETWWAGYGMTSYASECYQPRCIATYLELERRGQKSIRTMFKWNWRQHYFYSDKYMLNFVVWAEGKGSDYFWYGGTRPVERSGSGCTIHKPLVELPDSLRRGEASVECAWAPGTKDRENLYNYIKAGGRFINVHTVGDKDIDHLLDVIEEASREAGFTLEEIRAKRHGFDHTVMAPRFDQLERMKKLGIIVGGDAMEIVQAPPAVLKLYGEKAVQQVVPKRWLIEAGIPNGFEIDRTLGATDLTIFWNIARLIDRKAWDGKVYAPEQRIGRELALKTATVWGAYYLMRENVLGSLEAGKWADFIVIDRDYLTIPEEEIERIRVLMTVVGGKVVHLVPSLAKELGMKPTGAQVELGAAAAGW